MGDGTESRSPELVAGLRKLVALILAISIVSVVLAPQSWCGPTRSVQSRVPAVAKIAQRSACDRSNHSRPDIDTASIRERWEPATLLLRTHLPALNPSPEAWFSANPLHRPPIRLKLSPADSDAAALI